MVPPPTQLRRKAPQPEGSFPLSGDFSGCPACGAAGARPFYRAADVPAHSCVLMHSQEEALNYPRSNIRLALCESCGFIRNLDFDPSLVDYRQDYEETQGFSEVFNSFAQSLAERLVTANDLHGKDILEIGSGKGEFLALLCEIGNNSGTGIDPGYVPGRLRSPAMERMTFIRDYYDETYEGLSSDFICSRHTLEHIQAVARFARLLRRSIGERRDVRVFIEVPDTERVLKERAFWDIYHEHCSYFTLGSLGRLFRAEGFELLELDKEYDDQYLVLTAAPSSVPPPRHSAEETPQEVVDWVDRFELSVVAATRDWRARITGLRAAGKRVVVWGSGSKGVTFLTTLGLGGEIDMVIDINPHKQGKFMPGTGHRIVGPDALSQHAPDVVVAMNSVYCDEIRWELKRRDVIAEVVGI